MNLPHQDYFYSFNDLGESPSPTEIRRACCELTRQQHAFKHFFDKYPTDVGYLYGYLQAYVKNGVYDEDQHRHCYRWIETGLALADKSNVHSKLRQLKSDLVRQHEELLRDCGPDPPADESSPWFQFRRGNYDQITRRFEELRSIVIPCGILGPPTEREYWELYQFVIRVKFNQNCDPEAMEAMGAYEKGRIAVKLTPLPYPDLQEAVLGYLAETNIDTAIERLQFWIANSRMPIVSDVVRGHPSFKHLFAG